MSPHPVPVHHGQALTWDLADHLNHSEAPDFPRARAVLRAMQRERPEQLYLAHRRALRGDYGEWSATALRLLGAHL